MKKEYPKYKQGEVQAIEKRLSKDEKEILYEFLKKCSITAGEKKVSKIKCLVLQLRDVTEKPLHRQTKKEIDEFLSLLNNCGKSVWTKNEIKIYIKQFILWLYKDLEMVENFKTQNKRELNQQKITENNLVTEEDIEKMMRFAESYKDSAYLLIAWQTGARPQEIAQLQWKDITFQDKYADVTLYSGKTKKSRTFPVVEKTMKALWDWKQHYIFPDVKPQDYVFVSHQRGTFMTSAGLNKILRRLSQRAGLNKDIWNYLLRHSRATKLYEELPQQIVEKLMGHKNMAGIYAHISSKKAREAMLEKIYHIQELTQQEKDEIKKLREEVQNINKKLDTRDSYIKDLIQAQLSSLGLNVKSLTNLELIDNSNTE